MRLDKEHLNDLQTQLDELLVIADKYRTLKHQYGIASRKIHELKGELAQLRNARGNITTPATTTFTWTNQSNNYDTTGVNKLWDNPKVEPPHDLVLRSSRVKSFYDREDTFILKYGKYSSNGYSLIDKDQWWCIAPGDYDNTWSDWSSWVERYGPFVTVNESDASR